MQAMVFSKRGGIILVAVRPSIFDRLYVVLGTADPVLTITVLPTIS
jgi:hypothetical protein